MFVNLARTRLRCATASPVHRLSFASRTPVAMSAGWRKALDKSLEEQKDVPIAKFFQLATVRANGKPANRTMVFRGFTDNTDQVTFVTDHRTQKLEEFNNKDWAEICWYFPESREQYRIGGSMLVIDADSADKGLAEARKQAWAEQSPNARKWYTQPPPGKPRDQDDDKFNRDVPDEVHKEFVLVVLDSAEVDYLNLRENKRSSFTSSGSGGERKWDEQALNP